jgi:type 1 glutamine amidotransferase
MSEKRALITWGGWEGHEPEKVAGVFRELLENEGFRCEVFHDLACLEDVDALKSLHIIVPIWTMSKISGQQCKAVCTAVANGTGIAGCHGGMCDAFREDVQWQFLTGGNWVSHPGGDKVEYTVNIKSSSSPIVEGIRDFTVTSEQYYLHTDPANEVLATTRFPTVRWFHSSNRAVDMPVVWTKRWGVGRVFYTSLGHHADTFDIPEAREILRRGLTWVAEGKDVAIRDGLDGSSFESEKKMF